MKKLVPASISIFIIFLGFFAAPAQAQTTWSNDCVVGDVATIRGISCLVGNLLSSSLTLLGILFFIMLVVGGFRYLMAGGDPKATDLAKNTITSALMAILLVFIGWFALRLIAQITGIDVLNLRFPFPD